MKQAPSGAVASMFGQRRRADTAGVVTVVSSAMPVPATVVMVSRAVDAADAVVGGFGDEDVTNRVDRDTGLVSAGGAG